MGSGLCRRTGGRNPRATGVDGFYRKIVFNYAKKWTRYSDKHEHSKCGEKNTKHNKSRKNKPIISCPFPADPDRLEGDKWQYVILTRLDTEPPPERPPRTKRQRQQRDTMASGRSWESLRRRSFGRKRPPRPRRRIAAVSPAVALQPSDRDNSDSAAELMRLAMMVYLRRPNGRPIPAWTSARAVAAERTNETPSLPIADHSVMNKTSSSWILHSSGRTRQSSRSTLITRDGFFQSVDRIIAMTNSLLL